MKWEKLIQSGFRMPFYMNLYVRGAILDIEKIIGLKYKDNLIVLENQINTVYFSPELQKNIENVVRSKVVSKKFAKSFLSTFEKADKDLLAFCADLKFTDFSKLNKKILVKQLGQFSALFRAKFSIYGLPVIVDMALAEVLPTILNKTLSNEDLMVLTRPEKHSEYVKERRHFIEMVMLVKSKKLEDLFLCSRADIIDGLARYNPEIYYKLENHVRDFGWVGVSHNVQPTTIDVLIKNITEGLKDHSLAKELDQINEETLTRKKQKLIFSLKLNEKSLQVIKFITRLNEIKESRKVAMSKSILWSYPLFDAIATVLETDTISLRQLTLEEIIVSLKTGGLSSKLKLTIRDRLNLYVCLAKNSTVSNFSGVEAEKILKNELGTVDYSKAQKLSGNVAQKGLVQGKVRLIISEHEVHKLLDGEILVTSMTDPDMISAMKKAGAIVTDEGGITCHAAIVARELKKPCIIGTKIATKVLKDGDMVEVDANTGVVKILKRNEK